MALCPWRRYQTPGTKFRPKCTRGVQYRKALISLLESARQGRARPSSGRTASVARRLQNPWSRVTKSHGEGVGAVLGADWSGRAKSKKFF